LAELFKDYVITTNTFLYNTNCKHNSRAPATFSYSTSTSICNDKTWQPCLFHDRSWI